ncbi:hypothetical protein BKA62DRAFT_835625 [Auriculariales sp. MPI-PUGE-AT-0066]|nr:hypothetical protein BKA62DRAFT_835625 [Auriculariales sp. MPI-PUGE-AT-0066]
MKLKKAEAENAALRQQRDIDQQELETLRKKRDEEEQLKQQRDLEMSDALARLETELILAREDAAAVDQVDEEDNVDGDTICILFSDLVTNIDDLVFGVFEQLSLAEVTSPIVVDRKVFAATDANIINTIWPFLVSVMGSRPTVDTVAVPAMRCIASSILYSQILQPFYPINTDFSGDGCFEGLMQLWSSVAEQESQEVMGRWRSIAYRAVRHPQADDDDFLENMAKQLLTSLRDVMVLLLPQRLSASRDWEQLIDLLMPHALEVLRKANDFQSITQGQCVSWDYMVYHPPSNRTFHGDTMDVDTEFLRTTQPYSNAIPPMRADYY